MTGYRLKISVKDSNSPIWRIVDIPGLSQFTDLHQLIQVVFGLNDFYEFEFYIKSKNIRVTSNEEITGDIILVDCFSEIGNYLENGMVIDYVYDLDDEWNFTIEVLEMFENSINYSRVVDYHGYSLSEECGGIKQFEEMLENGMIDEEDDIVFDIEGINQLLRFFEVSEVLNKSDLKYEFCDLLRDLNELINLREINDYQVIKLISKHTSYWVIINTFDGYALELFENYDDLIEGFYNIINDNSSYSAFCNCWTFLFSDNDLDSSLALDEDQLYAVFKNQAGYLPSLLEIDEAKYVYDLLTDFKVALSNDDNTSEFDEIIEIKLENSQFVESSIFVHEPKINLHRYNYGYKGQNKIQTTIENTGRVCLDVACIPNGSSYFSKAMTVYIVMAGEDDYLIKEAEFPTLRCIGETLIDAIIDYSNSYGKPVKLSVGNINVLFLILEFINENSIFYQNDDIKADIELALVESLDAEDYFDKTITDELSSELSEASKEELEEKLNAILGNKKIIN